MAEPRKIIPQMDRIAITGAVFAAAFLFFISRFYNNPNYNPSSATHNSDRNPLGEVAGSNSIYSEEAFVRAFFVPPSLLGPEYQPYYPESIRAVIGEVGVQVMDQLAEGTRGYEVSSMSIEQQLTMAKNHMGPGYIASLTPFTQSLTPNEVVSSFYDPNSLYPNFPGAGLNEMTREFYSSELFFFIFDSRSGAIPIVLSGSFATFDILHNISPEEVAKMGIIMGHDPNRIGMSAITVNRPIEKGGRGYPLDGVENIQIVHSEDKIIIYHTDAYGFRTTKVYQRFLDPLTGKEVIEEIPTPSPTGLLVDPRAFS